MKKVIGVVMAVVMSIAMIFEGGIAYSYNPLAGIDKSITTAVLSDGNVLKEQYKDCLKLKSVSVPLEWTATIYDTNRYLYEHRYNFKKLYNIQERAFYNCPNLKSISVPEETKIAFQALGYYDISGTAQQDPDFLIVGFYNSDAERYARENNFKFQAYEWYTARGLIGEEDVWKAITPTRIFTPGDVNFDGVVTIEDAQEALTEYVTNLSNERLGEPTVATDVSGDNCYDIEDAQLILKYYTMNLASEAAVTWLDVKR